MNSLLFLSLLLVSADPETTPVASITASSQGQPIAEQTEMISRTILINLGQQIKLSSDKAVHANKSTSLVWSVEPRSIQVDVFPDNSALILTGPIVPSTIFVQQIVSLNDSIAWQKLTIICGTGSLPPPLPVPPPLPPPQPELTKRFFLSLVSEAKLATADEANVRNSVAYWNGLKLKGHDWIFYDTLSPENKGKSAVAAMKVKGLSPPALVIDHDGKNLTVVSLPKTTAEIDSLLKQLGGVQ